MAITLSKHRMRASEILFDIGAVHFNLEEPFVFTSGWASPVYVNCRKLISTTWQRREIIQIAAEGIERDVGLDGFDVVAGGETAGIPDAAWIADYFHRPMVYVRKRTKEFGLKQRIEGVLGPNQRVLIVEDLMTDGMSKVDFANALKDAGASVEHALVVFNYGVYPDTEKNLAGVGLSVHALTDWSTTLDFAESGGYFTPEQVKEVRAFLSDPSGWSEAHGGVSG